MVITELLSNRLFPKRPGKKWEYLRTTKQFENQSISNLMNFFSEGYPKNSETHPNTIANSVCKRFNINSGDFAELPNSKYNLDDLYELLKLCSNLPFLDVLELCNYELFSIPSCSALETYKNYVSDQNEIFKQNGIGYRVINGRFIPITDKGITDSIIEPVFESLFYSGFTSAHDELTKSFDYLCDGDYESAIMAASKSLECTIDQIIKNEALNVRSESKIRSKIMTLSQKGIIPSYNESVLNNLISLLESSNIIRNKFVAHGTIDAPPISDEMVEYVIHTTSTNILFIVRSYLSYKSK